MFPSKIVKLGNWSNICWVKFISFLHWFWQRCCVGLCQVSISAAQQFMADDEVYIHLLWSRLVLSCWVIHICAIFTCSVVWSERESDFPDGYLEPLLFQRSVLGNHAGYVKKRGSQLQVLWFHPITFPVHWCCASNRSSKADVCFRSHILHNTWSPCISSGMCIIERCLEWYGTEGNYCWNSHTDH